MGQRYFLNKEDYSCTKKIENSLTLKEVLTSEEARDLIEIQNVIASEITEPISILKEDSLIVKKPMRPKGLVFCLAHDDSKCVGYGYGYIDDDGKTFYLDTIGVFPKYRAKKIGTEIKVRLINYAFDTLKLNRIVAITQADNKKTMHINEKLGFKIDA